MSLADLKKQTIAPSSSKPKSFTVDDFIEDAANYALGKGEIVNADMQMQLHLQAQQLSEQLASIAAEDKPFKHATFTLSEEVIEQLNELSSKTNIAKSRLLRILVHNFYYKENPSQLHISDVK